MLLSLLTSRSNPTDIIVSVILALPMIILALSLHETAHGYVAWKCGDPTARNLGRLTLDPRKHLDLMGTICMLLVGFGWAKPVPINSRYFRKPKRDMALTAIAGPAANLLLGLIFAVLFGCFWALYVYSPLLNIPEFFTKVLYWGIQLFSIGAQMNFFLMVFNLLPVPPFDGSRVALAVLPTKQYFAVMRYERQIMLGVLVALLVLSYVFNFSPFSWVANQLTNLVATPVANLIASLIV